MALSKRAGADQDPYVASPSGNTAPSQGFSATDSPQVTRPGGVSTTGADQAQAAFDAMGEFNRVPPGASNVPFDRGR